MKMVKSLLLGSAAGVVAVAGAQAADLPVKAAPVQYVKICSLYGVGFYYIPGTDMCIKIGGWVRAEYAYGANGNISWGWANNNVNNRITTAEMRRTTQIAFAGNPDTRPGGLFPGQYGGFQMPDIVANIRVDQAWGSAQIMGALHQVNATYYGGATGVASGHPDHELGFAIGAGIRLNAPMIGQGDFFQAQINYTHGALRYIFQTPNSNWGKVNGARRRLRCAQRCGLWREYHYRQCLGSQPDHRLEHQRGLRSFLESAVANLALWRLCRGELQRPGQQDRVRAGRRQRGQRRRHHGGCFSRLR